MKLAYEIILHDSFLLLFPQFFMELNELGITANTAVEM